MDAQALFVDTLEDLRRRTELRASAYDIAQAAGLLRRLLLDKRPLFNHLDRETRRAITCHWTHVFVAFKLDSGGGIFTPMLWLDPELVALQPYWRHAKPNVALQSGTVHEFLRYPVVGGAEERATVKDLIRHYAHREGGVHADDRAAEVPVIDDLMRLSEEAPRRTMVAIGRIVARALEPVAAQLVLSGWPTPMGLAPKDAAAIAGS